ncbi:MAG: polyketide synthase dehydratase domain-containing protein, partial [bacterium]|nr:polyketide synthase dehydratase domain-containing protein [bacterium]
MPNPLRSRELFTIATKDIFALTAAITLWCEHIKNHPQIDLAQLCYNLHLHRSHYSQRLAIITDSLPDLLDKLLSLHADLKVDHKDIFINYEINKSHKGLTIADFNSVDLVTLAKNYVNHASIQWSEFEADRFYPHLDMPFYPWQHKKYWPTLGHKGSVDEIVKYPLRGERVASPLSLKQFKFIFDTKILPEVKDSFHVLHAGYYLEMIAFAMQQMHQKSTFNIQNLSFRSPLLVLEGKTVHVQLILKVEEDNSYSLIFYSNEGNEYWIENAIGTVSLIKHSQPQLATKHDVIKRSKIAGTAELFYNRVIGMGMPAGDTIRWTNNYWVGDEELLSELRLAKSSDRCEQFTMNIHPGIIDACIQTLFLLLPPELTKPYIASNMGSIDFYGVFAEPMYIYTQLNQLEPEGKIIKADCYLLDKEYLLIAKFSDIYMTQLNDTMHIEQLMHVQSQFQLDLDLPYEECKIKLMDFLIEQFALVFSVPKSDINLHQSLHDLGMDSLMALAVMRIIET